MARSASPDRTSRRSRRITRGVSRSSSSAAFAYLYWVGFSGISRIDLAAATVTAYSSGFAPAGGWAIRLSADGRRLYALVRDGAHLRLLLLDAQSLRELARSGDLPDEPRPFALVAVVAAR